MEVKTVFVERRAMDLIRHAVKQAYPKEACGALIGRMKPCVDEDVPVVTECKVMENHTTGKEVHSYFRMDPLEIYRLELQTEKEGKRIIGFYHSHPDAPAELSEEDEEYFIPDMIQIILSLDHSRIWETRAFLGKLPEGEIMEIELKVEETNS